MKQETQESIGIDLKGRVKSIKLAERCMLLPLFEAIVNSIHAIEDSGIPHGGIIITLERDASIGDKDSGFNTPDINKFIIEDNGIGFNEDNYSSFKRAYSTYKAERGGKGLGRFIWLKAFTDVRIESTFYKDKKPFFRSFCFNLKSESGIQNPNVSSIDGTPQKKTTVELNGYKNPYKSKCPKKAETIANRIVEHCLIYFLESNCPNITIIDGPLSINLNKRFEELTSGNSYIEPFNIDGKQFKLTLFKWFEHDELTYHKMSLCANNREVEDFNINKVFPDIQGKICDEESGRYYLITGYIESSYFDENVNDERTEISFAKGGLFDNELIGRQELYSALEPIVKKHFETVVANFREKKLERLNKFINEIAPQYRLLTSREGILDNIVITDGMSEQDIDLRLYKVYQEIDFESRKEVVSIIKSMDDEEQRQDNLQDKYQKVLHSISEVNKSKLAQYIVHRKYIMDLFEKSLALNKNGKYELEKTVHDIVFPTKKDTDEVLFEDQNLWIIDERLSFHTFLTSDKPLNSIDGLETVSTDRPDIAIFNNPVSFSEGGGAPLNSVVLIEFKRPMRKQYNPEEDNPIEQTLDYVSNIRAGKKIIRNGRPYPINENTIFYAYIVCDINQKVERSASYAGLSRTHDGLGFYGYNKDLKCMIEVLTFDQILSNAKKRNKVLFTKLGIH